MLKKTTVMTLFLLALVWALPAMAQEMELIEKTDNFSLFVDHSSSMTFDYQGMGRKIAVAKDLLGKMNSEIPELDYNGGLHTFAPSATYLTFRPYRTAEMQSAIDQIDTAYSGLFSIGRNTPIGNGLMELAPRLQQLQGRIALILFTDGGQNKGRNPIYVVRDMVNDFGDRLCIHVVSFAETAAEKALVERLRSMTDCGIMVSAADLQSPAVLNQFVKDVFYDTKPAPAPTPKKVEPKPEPKPEPVQVMETIVLNGITFDLDKAVIKPEMKPVLDEAVTVLKKRQDIDVLIEGHTCDLGSDAYNQNLSERRAQAVKDYLVGHGIDADRLETVGYGESQPRFANTSEANRARNRRVELEVK